MTTHTVSFPAEPTGPLAPVVVAPDPNRPAWLPEKFATPEAFAASYVELERKQSGAPPPVAPPVTAPVVPPVVPPVAQTPEQKAAAAAAEADAKSKLATVGLNYESLQAKFMSTGKIDETDYVAAEKIGLSRAVVDGHIADKVAAADRLQAETMAIAGGKDAFEVIAGWVRAGGYTPVQLQAYNDAVESGDTGRMQLAVKAVKADYDKANGVVPRLLRSTTVPSTGGDSYASNAQFLSDQANPLYKTDPAFRAKVEAKLARSPNI